MKDIAAACFGEFLGTLILVFFGTATVAVAVLFKAPAGLVQVAPVWGIGTFLLVTLIFLLTESCNVGRPGDLLAPVFIGATVSALIAVTAPLTQTGINPARDLGPRIVAYLAGWGPVAIPGPSGGFFRVYILAPLIGGAAAAGCFRYIVDPLMKSRSGQRSCKCIVESAGGCKSGSTA